MTTNLNLGAEFLYQKIPGVDFSAISLAGNYKADEWEVIGKLGMHQLNLCKPLNVCSMVEPLLKDTLNKRYIAKTSVLRTNFVVL